jgi:hypothetical protein
MSGSFQKYTAAAIQIYIKNHTIEAEGEDEAAIETMAKEGRATSLMK